MNTLRSPFGHCEIPAIVRAGLCRRIGDAYGGMVDGHPVSQGMPLEPELRYHYNYLFPYQQISWEAFLSELSRDVSHRLPGLAITPDWIRGCDAMGRCEAARRSLQRLRDYVETGQYYRTSFWDNLWTLTEVSIRHFGITCAQIGTHPLEIRSLSRQYLLRECEMHVEALKAIDWDMETPAAQKAFLLVDRMLRGIPIPSEDFCRNTRTYYSPHTGYAAYRKVATESIIPPAEVGWSWTRHLACHAKLFPGVSIDQSQSRNRLDPTAYAVSERNDPYALSAPSAERPLIRIPIDAAPAAMPPRRRPKRIAAILEAVLSYLSPSPKAIAAFG